MVNVDVKVVDGKLVLTIDLTKRNGLSSSKKTTIVGTTNGFSRLPPPFEKVVYSLNVVTKET